MEHFVVVLLVTVCVLVGFMLWDCFRVSDMKSKAYLDGYNEGKNTKEIM